MNLKNCSQCGKLYVENSRHLCPDCMILEEEDEHKIVEYLRDVVDRASIDEIHEATGVPIKVINRMIKQGRIITNNMVTITYPCEGCGTPITEGQYCPNCRQERTRTLQDLKESIQKGPESEPRHKSIRMYTQHEHK